MFDTVILLLIAFFGAFTQTVSGFGMGLIMMPGFASILGLETARPLVTLLGSTAQAVVMIRNRRSLTFGSLGVLTVMGLGGVWIGNRVIELGILPEAILKLGLAAIIIGYALYALLSPTMPHLKTDRWAWPVGLMSGVLSGTYNTGGPPVVIYADARRWTPEMMRSNLSGFFLTKGLMLMWVHFRSGNFTPQVMNLYYLGVPVLIVGMLIGFSLYGKINDVRFRQIVLILLLAMGVNILRGVVFG
ncbi:MAG: sulfite exporter TauE/SafE family protein [Chloroflexota bacterium]